MKVFVYADNCDKSIAVQEDHFVDFVSSSIEKEEEEAYCPFIDDFEEYLEGHVSIIDCFLQKETKEDAYLGYKQWIERNYSPNWTITELL